MQNRKTQYNFIVNANIQDIEAVIQNYLRATKFVKEEKPNANYYYKGDEFIGYKSFEYYINGNCVTILAYIGKYENPKPLEGWVGALPKHEYKSQINFLGNQLQQLQMSGNNNIFTSNQSMNAQSSLNSSMNNNMYSHSGLYNNQYGNGTDTNYQMERFEKATVICFIASIVGFFLSLIGVVFGIIIIFAEYYYAIKGLKTRKKGLAIATLVLATIDLLVAFLNIFVL